MRYAQATEGYETYGIETDSYEKADTGDYFGLVRDDVDYPNPNPQTAMTTGGVGRQPYVNSADPIEREFDMTVTVIDDNVPLELALGQRETSDQADYTEHIFTETDVLPTATIEHVQADVGLTEWFIGCKASLDISASSGEALTADLSFTPADHDFEEDTVNAAEIDIPEMDPYRFNMIGEVTLSDPADGSTVDSVATPNSVDFSWDNGNEVRHHGKGREGYAVAETTAEDKYDMSMGMDVEDLELYKRAAEDGASVDVEVVFDRDYSWEDGGMTDAVIITLKNCDVTEAPVPNQTEGVVEVDVGLLPTDTEIEIRSPN